VAPAPSHPAPYAERLSLPWWLWLAAGGLAALLAAEIWLGAGGARAWVPFAAILPAVAAALWWLGRIRIAVQGDELLVDDARLPVAVVADALALDAAGRREVLGVAAHPYAFVVQRPWIAGAVQVILADPEDPTPYWVVSSRHPLRLTQAILAARDAQAERGPAPGDRPTPGPR
jgi:hypothetical protein